MKMGYSETSCRAIYCTFGYYILITMHRGPVSSLVKLIVIYSVPVFLSAVVLYGIENSIPSVRLRKNRKWNPR